MTFHCPDAYRVVSGPFGSHRSIDGDNGAFFLPHPNRASSLLLKIIASNGLGWEHVSVSLPSRCPTWGEMAFVKSIFWDPTDCVVQFHPPETEYVNNHQFCLHLWRPTAEQMPIPPAWMVGYKSIGVLA